MPVKKDEHWLTSVRLVHWSHCARRHR